MKQAILNLFTLLLPIAALAQANCTSLRYQDTIYNEVKVTKDIKFGTATPYGLLAQPQDLYMDIYEPANDTQSRRPLIIFQFGGGFLIGWRTQPPIPQYCEYFAKCGYVVATIDYRIGFDVLSTGSAERAVIRAVQDQRAAVRHLCQRASQYKVDTASIFLTGTSAGCFAGLHSTFMLPSQIPASAQGILLEPADLGSIDSSGNNDYGNRSPRARGIINHWGAILDTSFIDTTDTVPVLSIHGTADLGVPYEYGYPFSYPVFPNVYGSKPIAERMTNLGLHNVLVPLVGLGHEPELLNSWVNDTMTNAGRRFLWNIIKPVTSNIAGNASVCIQEQPIYSVVNTVYSKYCWQVTGAAQIMQNSGSTIKLSFTDTGMVNITVTELNYMGAQGDVKTFTLHVSPQPLTNFSYSSNELTVIFTDNSSNLDSYNWYFGDGNSSSLTSPTYTYTVPGTYTVMLTGGNEACADTATAQLQVDYCPEADFEVSVTNYNGVFAAQPTNTTSYQWYFGDGDSASVGAYNVFHQYQQSGTYTAILKVSNALGCTASDTVQVIIKDLNTGVSNAFTPVLITYSNDILSVKVAGEANVLIYDFVGKLIHTQQVHNDTTIATDAFAKGSYLVKLAGRQTAVFKFVKQ